MILSYDTAEAFALKRNPVLSFPFLKENGELLRIAVDSGCILDPRALALYGDFYKSALKLTELYPPYFRFILGMIIDLEKGGMQGDVSKTLAQHILDEGFVLLDLSDTRKLETLSMLEQVIPLSEPLTEMRYGIIRNVDHLISYPDTYTKLNKPLFYELTHIVFFLTDYGKRSPPLNAELAACLTNMGLLCLLDNDADLLAEICTCLAYIGAPIPEYWDSFLQKNLQEVQISYHGTVSSSLNSAVDEYHIYFVLNWYAAVRERPLFQTRFQGKAPSFSLPVMPQSILSKLSDVSHQFHFSRNNVVRDLSSFVASLNDQELLHWKNVLKSSSMSQNLIEKFSELDSGTSLDLR